MYLCHYVNNQNGPTLLRGEEGGHCGLLNRRTEKKKKNRNKNSLKAENRIKNHQTDFSHPRCQNPNRSDTVDRWSTKRFHSYVRSMEAKNCPQIEEELEPKWEKPKSTSDTKSKNLLVLLMKTENQVPKFGNMPTTINTKTVKPKFFWHIIEEPI